MEISFLQLLGLVLIYCGGYCLIKGEIRWSLEAGPYSGRRGGTHIDVTPGSMKYQKRGVYTGKFVRPIGVAFCLFGILLMLVFTGDDVAFSI